MLPDSLTLPASVAIAALLCLGTVATAPLDARAVQQVASDALRASLCETAGWRDVVLEPEPLDDIMVEGGPVALMVRHIDAQHVKPQQRVWVDLTVNGRFQRSIGVMFGVRARRLALRTRQPVAARTVLQPDALQPIEIDPFQPRGALMSFDNDATWITTRALQAGEIVEAAVLRDPGRIERGQPVQIVLRENGLAISDAGTALDTARVGEPVRVMGRRTTRPLLGRVATDGSVLLQSGDAP